MIFNSLYVPMLGYQRKNSGALGFWPIQGVDRNAACTTADEGALR